MKNNIYGVGVALVTPFTISGEVDYDALAKLVNHVSDGGVDYLVALGTTAETPTLTYEEKNDIIAFIIDINSKNRSLPLVVGIGGNCTKNVVDEIKKYDFTGIDAILSVVPYYNKPSQTGIYEHYKAIAKASPIPIILYNVPSRTGVSMTVDTTLKLAADFDNIIGIKEATGTTENMVNLLKWRQNSDFRVISGDDSLALDLKLIGGDGVISVIANLYPDKFSKMLSSDSQSEQQTINKGVADIIDAIFAEGNPIGIKEALFIKGMMSNTVRLPLVSVTNELSEKITNLIKL